MRPEKVVRGNQRVRGLFLIWQTRNQINLLKYQMKLLTSFVVIDYLAKSGKSYG